MKILISKNLRTNFRNKKKYFLITKVDIYSSWSYITLGKEKSINMLEILNTIAIISLIIIISLFDDKRLLYCECEI